MVGAAWSGATALAAGADRSGWEFPTRPHATVCPSRPAVCCWPGGVFDAPSSRMARDSGTCLAGRPGRGPAMTATVGLAVGAGGGGWLGSGIPDTTPCNSLPTAPCRPAAGLGVFDAPSSRMARDSGTCLGGRPGRGPAMAARVGLAVGAGGGGRLGLGIPDRTPCNSLPTAPCRPAAGPGLSARRGRGWLATTAPAWPDCRSRPGRDGESWTGGGGRAGGGPLGSGNPDRTPCNSLALRWSRLRTGVASGLDLWGGTPSPGSRRDPTLVRSSRPKPASGRGERGSAAGVEVAADVFSRNAQRPLGRLVPVRIGSLGRHDPHPRRCAPALPRRAGEVSAAAQRGWRRRRTCFREMRNDPRVVSSPCGLDLWGGTTLTLVAARLDLSREGRER
jgi:hypothetical protein